MKRISFILTMIGASMFLGISIQAQSEAGTVSGITMKRFMVERDFPNQLLIPVDSKGSEICLSVVTTNLEDKVTWVHSYVSDDKKKTYCIYDAPSPEAIRRSAEKNGLPVGNIVEVSVLDPYFYK